MAQRITPSGLVRRELGRRRTVSRAPGVPDVQIPNPPAEQLYDFGQVGGLRPQPAAMMQNDIGRQTAQMFAGLPADALQDPNAHVALPESEQMAEMAMAGADDPTAVRVPPQSPIQMLESRMAELIKRRGETASRQLETDDSKLANAYQGFKMTMQEAARRSQDPGYLIGAALGGTLRGLFAPKEYEEYRRDRDVAKIDAEIGKTGQEIDADIGRQFKNAQIRNIAEDNERQLKNLERQTEADKQRFAYWARKADQGDLKLANDQELLEMRDRWMNTKNENDKRRLDLVEKEMQNRMERSDKDRQARLDIAGIRESGQNARTLITSADRARATLTAIEKNAPEGATPEQIKAKKDEFLRTLSPEIRKQLNQ
jgi:hypothetical protein